MSEALAAGTHAERSAEPADAAERARALDPARSFIVQAPAGSGKTELLIQRFLVLLARVERPEEITAITFTRKAAAEMRKRILEVLRMAREEPRPAAAHRARTWELGRAVLARSDAMGWAIQESATRLRVQTIDALCAALTRQMPVLARFGSQPESIDDATLLYHEAARATIEQVEEDSALAASVARVLEHLDNDAQRAATLIADLLARRDQWMRLLHLADERSALEAILAGLCRAGIEKARDLLPPGHACPGADDLEGWRRLVDGYLTKEGEWRARGVPEAVSAREGLLEALRGVRALPKPCYDDAQWEVLSAMLDMAKVAAGQLKVVFAARGQADFTEITQAALRALETPEGPTDLLLALDYRIRHILVDEFQDTSYSQFELLRRLTSGWSEGDGRTLFVVGDPMQSIYRFREAEVGLFLRARRDGIGAVGLEALRLTANFRSQAGIVAWVNETFARVLPEDEDIARGAVPYSASVAIRPAHADAVTVHAFFDNDARGEADEVVRIARAALEGPGSAQAASTVGILVRNRAHLAAILPCLRAAGLRYHAIEIEPLAGRPLVQDLVALTRALWHLADRTAWLAILRAPWCGLSLADLWRLAGIDADADAEAARRARHDPPLAWDLLRDDAVVERLSPEGARRARRVREVLAASLAARRRGRLRDAVEGAWMALGGPACLATTADMEDVESYLDRLGAVEEGGSLADLEHFELSLEKLFAAPDPAASERLQVMTIHKAKGLEFDTVIVPGLGTAGRSDERRLFVWMERAAARSPQAVEFLLSPLDASGSETDPIYRYIRALDRDKEALQDARLLYVAATRARRSLHLMGDVKWDADEGAPCAPRKEALLHHLWPAVSGRFTGGPRAPSARVEVPGEVARVDTIERLRESALTFAAPPPVALRVAAKPRAPGDDIEFSWVGETARHAGTVVHRWLQRIAQEGIDAWDAARIGRMRPAFRRALAARGVNEADLEGAAARVAGALASCLEDPRARWILGPRADARTEHRMTLFVAGELRAVAIDRMFRDGGKLWIVDYKTSTHEGGALDAFLDRELERYRGQLEGYRAAFAGEPVGLGLYFPLVKGWREWS
jgi:ATP-dependent exoDNAse (exonuclease V) beta subunit